MASHTPNFSKPDSLAYLLKKIILKEKIGSRGSRFQQKQIINPYSIAILFIG